MILFGPCTTTKMTKKRDAETAPEDEPSGSKPAIESAVETSERPKYQAPSCMIWQHPTADATLFEFDLRNIQPLIEAALESTDGHLKVHPKILVFGNEAHMRRSVGFFANPKDTYGYFFSRQLFASVMPSQPMQRLINLVSELLGSEVNGVLVNHYADGSEYISPHSDDESGIGDAGVFCISVGAERRFELTSKDKHIPTPQVCNSHKGVSCDPDGWKGVSEHNHACHSKTGVRQNRAVFAHFPQAQQGGGKGQVSRSHGARRNCELRNSNSNNER